MGELAIVGPGSPRGRGVRLGKAREIVLPDALFRETAKEALDDGVWLRGIGRDELLAQPISLARSAPTRCEWAVPGVVAGPFPTPSAKPG